MKFLLDMPVSAMLLEVLEGYGYDGVHAHQIDKDRAADEELLEIARQENRVVITADLDFSTTFSFEFCDWSRFNSISGRKLLGY
jgi:predicted nuclease of predicted toxin-antitoxin system